MGHAETDIREWQYGFSVGPVSPDTGGLVFPDRLNELLAPSDTHNNQIILLLNTPCWIRDVSSRLGYPVDLVSVPEEEWDAVLSVQPDILWLLGVWEPSEDARVSALAYIDEYRDVLPDIQPEDIGGSLFAVRSYTPNRRLAKSWDDWDRMRDQLNARGVRVIGDIVSNHTATDHTWITRHPEYYLHLDRTEGNAGFLRPDDANGTPRWIAHGKDPNFPPWIDTAQLDYSNPELIAEMIGVMEEIASHMDGARIDMAMLANPETFTRTWGWALSDAQKQAIWEQPFWPEALRRVRERNAGFIAVGEAYWEKQELSDAGFSGLYAKEFYDLMERVVLADWSPEVIRKYLRDLDRNALKRQIWFTENHDEGRAAAKFGQPAANAMAVLAGFIPDGYWLIHHGQERGWKRKIPMQVSRYPTEKEDDDTVAFYRTITQARNARIFQNPESVWDVPDVRCCDDTGNSFIVSRFRNMSAGALVATNMSQRRAKAFVPVPDRVSHIGVFDLMSGRWLTDIAQPEAGWFYVELAPWMSQIVVFDGQMVTG